MNRSNISTNADLVAYGAAHALIDGSGHEIPQHAPRLITNDYRQGRKILASIRSELEKCSSFSFSVAFITDGAVTSLLETLQTLESHGVPGRILTTDYLSFSDPKALVRLAQFSNIEVRMYRTNGIPDRHGFHTKGYLFERPDGISRALVGSANMTSSALCVNTEWNVEFSSLEEGSLWNEISNEFESLWAIAEPLDGVLSSYKAIYDEHKRTLSQQSIIPVTQIKLQPNSMQAAFTSNLEALVNDGEKRALLISATGTGKTYASAFAIRHLKRGRVLFLAHREQILKQAMTSYEQVWGAGQTFGLLSGNSHDRNADCLFATMQTMAKQDTLTSFDTNDFDIIVIDEVHRAGAKSYQKILGYFMPRLFLGMTASPDRPDGFDIYKLFDNNIAYELRLQRALEEDLLCPFHYFGITDLIIDGEAVDETTDFARLTSDARVEHIISKAQFYGHSGSRVKGLIFCRTNEEARELSRKLNMRGFSAEALSGKNSQEERQNAANRLAANSETPYYSNRLDYILTVDIFNEGIDIPEVNQVIMLRPTESPIVFVQQLGRGLRKANHKEYVTVIDFIGNYQNNFMIPVALSGDRSYNKDAIREYVLEGDRVIPGCSTVHFDEVSKERIFASIDNVSVGLKLLKEQYLALKHKLGRVPRMVDFDLHGEIDPLLFVKKKKSYYRFMSSFDPEAVAALSKEEHLVLEFISRYCANGMRPHELLALREAIKGGDCTQEALREQLSYFHILLDDADYQSACRVLDKSFVNSPSDKRNYDSIDLIEFDTGKAILGSSTRIMLANRVFADALNDIIAFGLSRFEERYRGSHEGLMLYQKYSRKDVCRLLNWERDDSATLYGYRIKYGTCPIFVTYEKKEDISSTTQYADGFDSPEVFSWMTRSRLTLDSPEVKKIVNADAQGTSIYLFVKKSDDEGTDFHYLGKAHPIMWAETTISDDKGNAVPIVNFKLKLETPVRESTYDYFSKNTHKQQDPSDAILNSQASGSL